jgi:metacaspase-1
MAKGISIHVGINRVDSVLFPGAPPLQGCENDAKEMFEVAQARGFIPEKILGESAKFETVQTAILNAAQQLQEGDVFLFTFAGHGSRRSDVDNDEADFQDETILLFDRILVDDFLRRALWSRFRPGVRIVGVADSCHSGTALFGSINAATPAAIASLPDPKPADALAADFEWSALAAQAVVQSAEDFSPAGYAKQPFRRYDPEGTKPTDIAPVREISTDESKTHLERFNGLYENLRDAMPTGEAAKLKANLLTLAACKDNEKTPDGVPNGVFTRALLDVLSSNPSASYDNLIRDIKRKFELAGRQQTPALKFNGPGQNFSGQSPFSI